MSEALHALRLLLWIHGWRLVGDIGPPGPENDDCPCIERELSELLPGTMINVRVLSPTERQGMIRLLTAEATQTTEASHERDAAVSQHTVRAEA